MGVDVSTDPALRCHRGRSPGVVVVLEPAVRKSTRLRGDVEAPADTARQYRHPPGRDGAVLLLPRHDRIRRGADGQRLRIRCQCSGCQRRVSTTRRSGRPVGAMLAGRYIERFGARAVVATGAFVGVVGFTALAIWHTHPWQVVLAGLLTNAYISLGFGALPVLVLQNGVAEHETGIATSLNAISRKVGSAIAAAMLAGVEKPAAVNGFIPESSFIMIFILGAVTALTVMLLALGRRR